MTGYFLIISSPELSPDPPALHKCGGPAQREALSSQRRGATGEAAAMAPSLLLLLLALLPRVFPLLGKCPQGLCRMRRAGKRAGWRPAPGLDVPGKERGRGGHRAQLDLGLGGGRGVDSGRAGGEARGHFNPLGAA